MSLEGLIDDLINILFPPFKIRYRRTYLKHLSCYKVSIELYDSGFRTHSHIGDLYYSNYQPKSALLRAFGVLPRPQRALWRFHIFKKTRRRGCLCKALELVIALVFYQFRSKIKIFLIFL